jgi:hypothetical protein
MRHAGAVFLAAVIAVSVAVNPATVSGWNNSTTTVQAGQRLLDTVRVKPRVRRTVVLQVTRVGTRHWKRVWKGSTNGRGRVVVKFPTLAEGQWRARLKVPSSRGLPTAMTAVRRVVVAPVTPDLPGDSTVPQSVSTVYVAGDIGLCPPDGDPDKTAALVDAPVIVPGDLAYPSGTASDFAQCYDPFWGPLKDTTFPVPGNHEYYSGAAAYFEYFGDRVGTASQPWYVVDIGGWRFYMLNSNCGSIGGCGLDSAQYAWLTAQLARSQPQCTAAVWHHPRWSSGQHGPAPQLSNLYELLAAHGTELLLTGHEHNYERFAPMSAAEVVDPAGIRQFVVGTGGQTMRAFSSTAPGSQVRLNDSSGVLRLMLAGDGFSWRFVPTRARAASDSGTGTCH